MTERPTLHIVSNADERFYPGLAVAVASAVAAASGNYDYHIRILDGGLQPESISQLRATVESIATKKGIRAVLETLEVDQNRLMKLPALRGSLMTYAKLMLPEMLPHLDAMVYLDADVLCFKGLEAAHPPEAEQSQWLLAGARDHINVIGNDCPWAKDLSPVERQLPYINAGIMWMNLKGLRELGDASHTGTSSSLLDRTAKLLHDLVETQKFRHDQTVFNFLCRGKSFILPESINHRTSIGSTRPLCEGSLDLNLHYIGSPKPWLGAPKTSNWLAHRLWHQARACLFPETSETMNAPPPLDLAEIRRKAMAYRLFNPVRATHYRSDLHSLNDPSGVIQMAQDHWQAFTRR